MAAGIFLEYECAIGKRMLRGVWESKVEGGGDKVEMCITTCAAREMLSVRQVSTLAFSSCA